MHDLKISKSITNRSEDSLNRYLSEISKYKLIKAEDEAVLARKIRGGDQSALIVLTNGNLRFVVSVAKKYQNRGIPLADLVNEGNIGLMRGALTFDETRGFKFISYAVWWIRQSIAMALKEQARMIRLPVNQQLGVASIMRQIDKLEQILEREPTLSEIAEAMDKTEAQISDFIQSNARTSFLNDYIPGGDSEEFTLLDFIEENNERAIDDWIETESRHIDIFRMLSVLTKREERIIYMFFGLNGSKLHSLTEIAEELKLSKERIRQLKREAVEKLRGLPRNEYLIDYIQ